VTKGQAEKKPNKGDKVTVSYSARSLGSLIEQKDSFQFILGDGETFQGFPTRHYLSYQNFLSLKKFLSFPSL